MQSRMEEGGEEGEGEGGKMTSDFRCISAGRDRTIRLWDLDRIVMDYESTTVSNTEY